MSHTTYGHTRLVATKRHRGAAGRHLTFHGRPFRVALTAALLVLLAVAGLPSAAPVASVAPVAPVAFAATDEASERAQTVAAAALAPPASVVALEQHLTALVQQTQPSVVEIESHGSRSQAIGSGVIVRADGYILTNDHVVRGFSSYRVLLADGRAFPAQLVGEAQGDDLAVLKIDVAGLRPIPMADARSIDVGDIVLALGSPLGLEQSVTFGIISAVNRSAGAGGSATLTGLIQTSAPINPGNSGGALVNLSGELVGIPTLAAVDASGSPANGIGFAITAHRAQFVVEQLIAHGRLVNTGQGFLGIAGVDVTAQLADAYQLTAQRGVLVTAFTADASGASPAQRAGVQERDIITRVNTSAIDGNAELAGALQAQPPGATVQLTIQRGSAQQQVSVTLGERPVSPAR